MAEKAETETGWLFPVGDEVHELGYVDMFADMLDALDDGREPMETFYDGYVVNAIMDACYRSVKTKRWEPVELEMVVGPATRVSRRLDRDRSEAQSNARTVQSPVERPDTRT